MSTITISNLAKYFESGVKALDGIDLLVNEQEFLVLLGPSGSGKTTTLRCVAGLEEPTTGSIYLGDRCVYAEDGSAAVAPKDRDIGLVFQNYALYPHMSVFKNVAFGLKIRKFSSAEIEDRVREVLDIVGLAGLEDRSPRELSGGQQQRVALARMIVRRPTFLLFDEPLSNLDPKLRTFLRAELKDMHRKLETTSIYVTHDQSEAMILGDRIAVLDKGRIEQIGKPDRIYHFPATKRVAEFTARPKTNFIEGIIDQGENESFIRPDADPSCSISLGKRVDLAPNQHMIVHVRPEDVDISTDATSALSVFAVQPQGPETLLNLRFADGKTELFVSSRNSSATELEYNEKIGVRIYRGNIYSPESNILVSSFGSVAEPVA